MSKNVKHVQLFLNTQYQLHACRKSLSLKQKHLQTLKKHSIFKLPNHFTTLLLTCKLLYKEISKTELEKLLYIGTPNLIKHAEATLPYTTFMQRMNLKYMFFNDAPDNEQVFLLNSKYIFTIDVPLTPALDEIPFVVSERLDVFRQDYSLRTWRELEVKARELFAANKIKRGCRNWMRKPRTKDGLVGIEPRVSFYYATGKTILAPLATTETIESINAPSNL